MGIIIGSAKDYQSDNKLIYFVSLPDFKWIASDDVLRYKLIYFVLQRMMFWRLADDVLLPPTGSMLSDGGKGCFHWVETSLLMSGSKGEVTKKLHRKTLIDKQIRLTVEDY